MVAYLAASPVSYVSPDTERFSFPSVNLTGKLQGEALLNVGSAARSLLSHGPGSEIIRAGLNQCRETGDTRLEANHDGKGKGRGEAGARTISTHSFLLERKEKGDRKIKSRMGKMGRAAFTCSGQEFIHSFTQEAFIKHRLCQPSCWVLEIYQTVRSWAPLRGDHRFVGETDL